MTANHICLVMSFMHELKDITIEQSWLDNARIAAPNNQRTQLMLDRKQTELVRKKKRIHETMFYIQISN